MIKTGIIGVGHLGEIHLKLILKSNLYKLTGFFDPDKERSENISKIYNVKSYKSYKDLCDDIDAVIICTPTLFHHEIAKFFLNNLKHVFIEKPITTNINQANELVSMKNKNRLVGQVGHVERFNGAFIEVEKILNPMFIESHRLSHYPERGTDAVSYTHLTLPTKA